MCKVLGGDKLSRSRGNCAGLVGVGGWVGIGNGSRRKNTRQKRAKSVSTNKMATLLSSYSTPAPQGEPVTVSLFVCGVMESVMVSESQV